MYRRSESEVSLLYVWIQVERAPDAISRSGCPRRDSGWEHMGCERNGQFVMKERVGVDYKAAPGQRTQALLQGA